MNDRDLLAPYIRTFFEDYLACRRNMAPNTIHSYRDAITLFLTHLTTERRIPITRIRVTDVGEAVVLSYLQHLESARANSIQTRNHRLIALHRLFAYIAAREPTLADACRPVVSIPLKRGGALPPIQYLTRDETAALIATPDCATRLGRRDHALLLFLYNTGARVQEPADIGMGWLCLLRPATVRILGEGRK